MFSTFALVGFVFSVAWAQQIFLNRLIASDQEHLKAMAAKTHEARVKALMNRSLS